MGDAGPHQYGTTHFATSMKFKLFQSKNLRNLNVRVLIPSLWVGPGTSPPALLQGPLPPAGKLDRQRGPLWLPHPKATKADLEKLLRDQCVYSQQHFRKRANTACPHTGDQDSKDLL